jgi:hypothetical protein
MVERLQVMFWQGLRGRERGLYLDDLSMEEIVTLTTFPEGLRRIFLFMLREPSFLLGISISVRVMARLVSAVPLKW